jgi:hypothetical protein
MEVLQFELTLLLSLVSCKALGLKLPVAAKTTARTSPEKPLDS